MEQLRVLDHPLVSLHVSRLRDQRSTSAEFRESARRLTSLLAFAATAHLETRAVDIHTPLSPARGAELKQSVAVIPVLRAGLMMVDPILDLLPEAEIWHFGVVRDETTALPTSYYCKLPEQNPVDFGLVLDPMLATGGTIRLVIDRLKQWGVPRIAVMSLIAAPEGVMALSREYPDVALHACAVDNHLNSQKFIVPGLGDAGDRAFNTLR